MGEKSRSFEPFRKPIFHGEQAINGMSRSRSMFEAGGRRLGELIDAERKAGKLTKGARAGGTKDGPRGSLTDPRDTTPSLAKRGIDKHLAGRRKAGRARTRLKSRHAITTASRLHLLQLDVGLFAMTEVTRLAVVPLHLDLAVVLNNGAALVRVLPADTLAHGPCGATCCDGVGFGHDAQHSPQKGRNNSRSFHIDAKH